MSSELSENSASGKALSKEAIVATAVELMSERGLGAVSLRRIATELGVSAPTLYWYIGSKRELLDGVAEYLLRQGFGESSPAKGQPWWEWLEGRARSLYEAMTATPDAPQVVAGNRPTPESLGDTDAALGALVAVGFSAPEAQQVLFAVGHYVLGMAFEWQAEAARERDGVAVDEAVRLAASDADRFPHFAAAARGIAHASPMGTFDYGLALLIRGLRARHEELAG